MALKVANGSGFEPFAKGGVSSKGLSLSFAFVYFSILKTWDNNKVSKICGARGPVCLSHAVPVLGPKLCPTGLKTCHLHSISIFGCENLSTLICHARKFNLERESNKSQHLGVTE